MTIERIEQEKIKIIYETINERFSQRPKFYCSRQLLAEKAKSMRDAFVGKVAYAVKANPNPNILKVLKKVGLNHFDVASCQEVQLVRKFFPAGKILFNNPIKTPAEIQEANQLYGVKHFTVQSLDEIDKIVSFTRPEDKDLLEIAVRLKAPASSQALVNHSIKFGVSVDTAHELLLYLMQQKIKKVFLSVHIGSANYTEDIRPFQDSLRDMYLLAKKSPLVCGFNLGGGFPANFYQTIDKCNTSNMLKRLSGTIDSTFSATQYEYYIEPGISLVGETACLITPVVYVDNSSQSIYIRDGVYTSYGCFHVHQRNRFPVYLYRRHNGTLVKHTDAMQLFTVFGQTCDGADKMEMMIPSGVKQQDLLCLETAGAYMGTLSTRFNSFTDNDWVFY